MLIGTAIPPAFHIPQSTVRYLKLGEIKKFKIIQIKEFKIKALRVEKDNRNEKIGYKIREHSNAKVPVILVIGKKESENNTVSMKRRLVL